MTATLHPNRTTPLAALWWLFQGALFAVVPLNASGVSPLPDYDNFMAWAAYSLGDGFDLYFTGGTAGYDASNTQKAKLPQLEIVLDYATTITYTHVLVLAIPAVNPGALYADEAYPIVAYIAESSPVTLSSTQTKTYMLDFTALWA